jgi:hypothetical protein
MNNENQKIEIAEAISAGQQLLNTLYEVQRNLNTASNLGIWDMLGGGLFVTMFKHNKIDKAKQLFQQAQHQAKRFQQELADVKIHYTQIVDLDMFVVFGDYFFDNFFMDFYVQTKINESRHKVEQLIYDVNNAINALYDLRAKL